AVGLAAADLERHVAQGAPVLAAHPVGDVQVLDRHGRARPARGARSRRGIRRGHDDSTCSIAPRNDRVATVKTAYPIRTVNSTRTTGSTFGSPSTAMMWAGFSPSRRADDR